jgi:hypothetical protein
MNLARRLLQILAPADFADAVLGDLDEEFRIFILPQHGIVRAGLWYLAQAVRSILPLLRLRMARGEFVASVAASQIIFALPLLAAERLRSYLLSLVPLKIDSTPSQEFLAAFALLLFFCAAAGTFLLCVARKRVDWLSLFVFEAFCSLYVSLGLRLPSVMSQVFALGLLSVGVCTGVWLWKRIVTNTQGPSEEAL